MSVRAPSSRVCCHGDVPPVREVCELFDVSFGGRCGVLPSRVADLKSILSRFGALLRPADLARCWIRAHAVKCLRENCVGAFAIWVLSYLAKGSLRTPASAAKGSRSIVFSRRTCYSSRIHNPSRGSSFSMRQRASPDFSMGLPASISSDHFFVSAGVLACH